MYRLRIAGMALLLAVASSPCLANPSLTDDFNTMSQWLSHELAQGLAFSAGSNFDPPREVKGYWFQPDLSLGVGRMPLDKRNFPTLTVPALNDLGGPNLFPNSVLFPNLALHLRMGLPWRGDFYLRLANATTPSDYKITPTMTGKVQTNSFGFGIRQHLFGANEEHNWPMLTLGAHVNHVQGYTRLKGKFNIDTNGFTADSPFLGDLRWNVNSFGLTAIVSKVFGRWTPFFGLGYNYASGTVSTRLELQSSTFLIADVTGIGSERPERSQGREIFGLAYNSGTWSLFTNAELKALGQLRYRSFIVQFGAALPFEIGRKPTIFSRKQNSNNDENARRSGGEEKPAAEKYSDRKIKNNLNDFMFIK